MSSSDATALLEKEAIEPAGDSRRASARYAEAVSLYATTRLTIREICALTGDSHRAFSAYLCQNHRDLILRRHGLEGLKEVKLRGAKGQSTEAYLKYHDAIAAADSVEYIDYNVSQIARIFGLDGTGLGNQLRHHYPEIIPRREKERRRLGVHDNIHRGVRPWCTQRYARAVEMLHTTDWTVDEVAETCDVTPNGLREHIACYHKELVKIREEKRLQAMRQEKVRGQRTGAWTIHKPSDETLCKYAQAVEAYRTSSRSIEEIAGIYKVHHVGLGTHIRQWYPELVAERRGFEASTKLSETKRYKKSSAEKYAEAIELLKNSTFSTAAVAKKFDLHPEVFRDYLKEHEPELASRRGMTTVENGKRVGVQSSAKYDDAIRLYVTTTEPLKSIAKRQGIIYNSLSGYVRRNFPELIEQHNRLLQSADERFAEGVELLRTSSKTISAVMRQLGYGEYFRMYVKKHHPELLNRTTSRNVCVKYPSVTIKYAEAILLLETTSERMKHIAARLDLNYSSLRKYLYKHHPELLKNRRKPMS